MGEERQIRLRKRNKKIRELFIKLSNKKTAGGNKLYTNDAILEMISEKFYLASSTINDIVFCKDKEES